MIAKNTVPATVKEVAKNKQPTNALRDTVCLADIGTTAAELNAEKIRKRSLFSQMPELGSGFTCYGPPEKRYGQLEVIRAIAHVCEQWHSR